MTTNPPKKVISKIDAARTQLGTAIKLYFDAYHQEKETGLRIFAACRNFRLISDVEHRAVDTLLAWFITVNPRFLAKDSPLKELIPNTATGSLDHSELTAIGYQMLQKACPELFPLVDLESRIKPNRSKLTLRIPST